MKKGIVGIAITCLITASLLLSSCSSSTKTSTSTTTGVLTTSTTSVTTSQLTTSTTSTTSAVTSTTAVTTSSTGNWWDSLGTPTYGSSITVRYAADPTSWDNWNNDGLVTIMEGYQSRLFTDQWTMNPTQWNYSLVSWRPDSVNGGDLVQSWDFPDPSTFEIHLRQGVNWQNIAPANGRQLVASDVVYNYDRLYALAGFPGSPSQLTNAAYKKLVSVTATDNFTVVFKWSIPNPTFILSTMEAPLGAAVDIECPEAIQQYGSPMSSWHDAIGTGPFILTDFVDNSSATFVSNPNYFGHDERYPQNKLPYVNSLKILVISDASTALAALRTGKIEAMGNIAVSDAQSLDKTNPNLVKIGVPSSYSNSIDPKGGVAPFTDIRVREAMQESINLPEIAKDYYLGTCSPAPSTMTSNNMGMGWGYPYSTWPASLQAQYAYNPTNAKALLAAAGFPNGFNTDVVADGGGDMGLLQIVQSDFAAIGINMTLRIMPTAQYATFVTTNHQQDALSMRGSGYLGMTFDVDRQMQRFLTGANWSNFSDPTCDSLYAQSLAATSVTAYQNAFNQMNQYIAQNNFMISLVTTENYYYNQPWLKGFMAQDDSVIGNSGPRLIGFYCARYWIDQSAK